MGPPAPTIDYASCTSAQRVQAPPYSAAPLYVAVCSCVAIAREEGRPGEFDAATQRSQQSPY